MYPLSFRWPRPNHPVALSDVFVCPPTFALKFPITIIYCDGGFYQDLINGVVEDYLSLHLSEMSLAHILERSSVGICLLCVGLVLLLWNSHHNNIL